MAERLATWAWVGAAVLAGVAGMVNVVGFLGFEHQAVSHLTGTTSLLGAAVAGGDSRLAVSILGVIAAFVTGAAISGWVIQDATLRLGRRYGVILMLESAVLCAAVLAFERHSVLGGILAALACGLQNAMASTYSGSVVRTSHLSGMFTDLGIFIGQTLRGQAVPRRRLVLCVTIILAFFLGGIAGASLFPWLAYRTLLVPAAITGLTGLSYVAYRLAKQAKLPA